MFETFDHTADLGLRIEAADLNGLFAEAACALTATLIDNPAALTAAETRELELRGDDLTYLFFDWLSELLFLFETDGWLTAQAGVEIVRESDGSVTGLTARLRGEPLDRNRHRPAHEIKAVTYHGLRVEPRNGGWLAEVIVDI